MSATNSSRRPPIIVVIASSIWNGTRVWSLSASPTQCTFAVARPSCASTGRMSSGSVSSSQSRSSSYGDSSATRNPVPLVLEVLADLRVGDDPARRGHVALLDREDDVVLQRLVVALEQHVVGGEARAADPEPAGADDVLHVVGDVPPPPWR